MELKKDNNEKLFETTYIILLTLRMNEIVILLTPMGVFIEF